MLHRIRHLLSKRTPSYAKTTLWVMCCLALFGFLKVSEFTIPTEGSCDSSYHLSLDNIAVDNRKKPRILQLFLKQSKTDQFRQCIKVYVSATDSIICPVKAMLSYLAKSNSQPGPLFITKEGKGWTSAMFHTAFKSL